MSWAHHELGVSATSIPDLFFREAVAEQNSYYAIESSNPLRTINSSMWGEGLGWHFRLLNRQVDKSYLCEDPMAEMHHFMSEKGIVVQDTAALLTAARVSDRGYAEQEASSGLKVCTWATVGLSNKARAGAELPPEALYPGTINLIVVVDGSLTDAAMVNAVITATEAKAAALQDCSIYLTDRSKALATGTTTDAVLIASTQRGAAFRYAGTSTELGYCIGRTVYEGVKASIQANLQWHSQRMGGQ